MARRGCGARAGLNTEEERMIEDSSIACIRDSIHANSSDEERLAYLHYYTESCARKPWTVIDAGGSAEVSYRDLFLQSGRGADSLLAGWVIAQFHCAVGEYGARWFALPIGAEPRRDSEREANHAALHTACERIASGCFASSYVDCDQYHGADGYIIWDTAHEWAPNPCCGSEVAFPTRNSGHDMVYAPLEIGTCHPGVLWLRYWDNDGVVARWPYGSQWVYVFGAFGYSRMARERAVA